MYSASPDMGATIRVGAEGDTGAITDIYTSIVEDTHFSFETTPPAESEMAGRIRETLERFPWVVCEYDGRVVGYSYASPHNDRSAYQWSIDVSVYIGEEWQRRGVAQGLYESLFALLRRQGFYTAYAVIALPNPPSVALHKDLGFERVGLYEKAGYKHGDWRDVSHWELLLQPHEIPPSPPIPFDVLRNSNNVDDALHTGESTIRL